MMRPTKKLPFTIIKTPTKKPIQNGSMKAFSDIKFTQNDLNGKRSYQDGKPGQVISQSLPFTNTFSIINEYSSAFQEMVQKYTEASINYCEEGFTSRTEAYLSRITISKNIPQEVKSNFPLQSVLTTICKIFMLNENEVIILACAVDRCGWKIDQVVSVEESEQLIEFPNTIVGNLNRDFKRLIIYLMTITSSIKQELNTKEDFEHIQAYCDNLCINLSSLVYRWCHMPSNFKYNYSLMEINLKFRELSQNDFLNTSSNINYNMIADNIISLSGCYKSKIEPDDNCSVLKDSVFNNLTKLVPSPSNSASTFLETVEHKSIFNDTTPITSLQNLEIESYFPKFDKLSHIPTTELSTLDEMEPSTSSLDMLGTLREEFGMNSKQMKLNNGKAMLVEPKEIHLVKQLSGTSKFFNNFDMDDYFVNNMINDKGFVNNGYNQLIAEEAPYLMKFSNSWYQD